MKKNFLKSDGVGGFIWLILGIGLCIGAIKLNLGEFHKPGPGFTPFFAGFFLGILGLILMLSTISKKIKYEEADFKRILSRENYKKLLFAFITLFGYIMLFVPLGFFLATFLFFFFSFKLTEPKKWLMPSIFSVGAVILNYLIFSVWLKCPLPRGILKF